MPVETEAIRAIQVELSARNPVPVSQGTITAANGAPSAASDGVAVLVSSGKAALFSFLTVEKGASVTSYDIAWWGYHAPRDAWLELDNSERTGLEQSWGQLVPTGPITRLYCEVTSITDSGSDGVEPVIAPCDSVAE